MCHKSCKLNPRRLDLDINIVFIPFQIQFMLLFSRQGKCRLQKWFVSHPEKGKKKITRELIANILTRKPKMCSFLEWKDLKVVYKRYGFGPHTLFCLQIGLKICFVSTFSDMLVSISAVRWSKMTTNWSL
jgi:hypothetical protein